jgi:anti-sigma factor RsiW
MNMASETDLEMLEAYLDDALSASEVVGLDRRLITEPGLAAALQTVRGRRAVRLALFKSHEPDDAAAEKFADMVIASARRSAWHRKIARASRAAATLAACVLVGFAAGWMGRGHGPAAPVASVGPHPAKVEGHLVAHVPKPGDTGGMYQVALTDENGNVIAVQKFNRVEDARQFADDLGQYQARRQQVEEGRPMLISDRF